MESVIVDGDGVTCVSHIGHGLCECARLVESPSRATKPDGPQITRHFHTTRSQQPSLRIAFARMFDNWIDRGSAEFLRNSHQSP